MIYEGSRYDGEPLLRVQDHLGKYHLALYVRPTADQWSFEFDQYVVTEGDRLDNLAGDAYGDPELWWLIARANPEVFYPDSIPPGTVIRIPYE